MKNSRKRAGFALIAAALAIVVLFGMLGVAFDLGRMYITKSEVQTFADLAAIAAARELDGTSAGITRARQVVAASQMKWGFGTKPFTDYTVRFSSDNENWQDGTTVVNTLKYVDIVAAPPVDLFFIPVVLSQPSTVAFLSTAFRININGRAVAGHQPIRTFGAGGPGVLPFAPLAHSLVGPNYGFTKGDIITLRWPSNVNGNKRFCAADDAPQWIEQSTIGGGDERGYIQETSSDAIREAVVDDKIFYTVTLGLPVNMTGGIKATQAASLIERAAQDQDVISTTYAQYTSGARWHNERRIGVVPIVNPNDNFRVLTFAKVFLPMDQDQHGNKSLCAEYIGPFHLIGAPATSGEGTGEGIFEAKLLQ